MIEMRQHPTGGGGKGMRIARDGSVLETELERARSEDQRYFGDGRLVFGTVLLGFSTVSDRPRGNSQASGMFTSRSSSRMSSGYTRFACCLTFCRTNSNRGRPLRERMRT